jgi:tRNA G18 (ribose-2'-O)-methylase SpoU
MDEAELNPSAGIALIIGNEGAGISRELVRQMDELITIPQSEKVESLNAGVATSIILYEAARQRRSELVVSPRKSQ